MGGYQSMKSGKVYMYTVVAIYETVLSLATQTVLSVKTHDD